MQGRCHFLFSRTSSGPTSEFLCVLLVSRRSNVISNSARMSLFGVCSIVTGPGGVERQTVSTPDAKHAYRKWGYALPCSICDLDWGRLMPCPVERPGRCGPPLRTVPLRAMSLAPVERQSWEKRTQRQLHTRTHTHIAHTYHTHTHAHTKPAQEASGTTIEGG